MKCPEDPYFVTYFEKKELQATMTLEEGDICHLFFKTSCPIPLLCYSVQEFLNQLTAAIISMKLPWQLFLAYNLFIIGWKKVSAGWEQHKVPMLDCTVYKDILHPAPTMTSHI